MFDLLIIYILSIAQVPREFSWKMVSRSRPSTLSLSRGRPALRGGGRGGGGRGRRETGPLRGAGWGLRSAPCAPRAAALCVAIGLLSGLGRRVRYRRDVQVCVPSESRGPFPGSLPDAVICALIFYRRQRRRLAPPRGPRPPGSTWRWRLGTQGASSRDGVCVGDHGHRGLLRQRQATSPAGHGWKLRLSDSRHFFFF